MAISIQGRIEAVVKVPQRTIRVRSDQALVCDRTAHTVIGYGSINDLDTETTTYIRQSDPNSLVGSHRYVRTFRMLDENGEQRGRPVTVYAYRPEVLRAGAAVYFAQRLFDAGILVSIEPVTHASETDDTGEESFAVVTAAGRFLVAISDLDLIRT